MLALCRNTLANVNFMHVLLSWNTAWKQKEEIHKL